MIRDRLEQYSYDHLMQLALSFVPDELDKREGSIIYDALAPFCQVLALSFNELYQFYQDTYILTASGEALDNIVAERGFSRYPATYAVKKGEFYDDKGNPMEVPIGSRFSSVSDINPIVYKVVAEYKEGNISVPGTYELECEVAGTLGNEYSGNLINITFIKGLVTATLSTLLNPARDEEEDNNLRQRYLDDLNQIAFGGNVADYYKRVTNIAGIGGVQIYPVWKGGGTVKLSIIDPQFNLCSSEFIEEIQQEIDPSQYNDPGMGLGIAPIGHKVTVVTPTHKSVNFSMTLIMEPGFTVGQVRDQVINVLSDYLKSLRQTWDTRSVFNKYECTVYINRALSSILTNVAHIMNIVNVKINNQIADLVLVETGDLQELPFLGTVTLNQG